MTETKEKIFEDALLDIVAIDKPTNGAGGIATRALKRAGKLPDSSVNNYIVEVIKERRYIINNELPDSIDAIVTPEIANKIEQLKYIDSTDKTELEKSRNSVMF